jgi:hypothetical protein
LTGSSRLSASRASRTVLRGTVSTSTAQPSWSAMKRATGMRPLVSKLRSYWHSALLAQSPTTSMHADRVGSDHGRDGPCEAAVPPGHWPDKVWGCRRIISSCFSTTAHTPQRVQPSYALPSSKMTNREYFDASTSRPRNRTVRSFP